MSLPFMFSFCGGSSRRLHVKVGESGWSEGLALMSLTVGTMGSIEVSRGGRGGKGGLCCFYICLGGERGILFYKLS